MVILKTLESIGKKLLKIMINMEIIIIIKKKKK
jgi:hypothetical protein